MRFRQEVKKRITLEGEIVARKKVRSSTGHPTNRIFVETTLLLAGIKKRIVVSLVSRKRMIYRLLLGREALGEVFLVNSSVDHWATPKRISKMRVPCKKKA